MDRGHNIEDYHTVNQNVDQNLLKAIHDKKPNWFSGQSTNFFAKSVGLEEAEGLGGAQNPQQQAIEVK